MDTEYLANCTVCVSLAHVRNALLLLLSCLLGARSLLDHVSLDSSPGGLEGPHPGCRPMSIVPCTCILYNTLFSREENFAKSEFEIFSREDIFANILFTRKYLHAKISSRENIFSRKYPLAKISSRENIIPRKYPPAKILSRDFFSCRKYVG